MRKSALYNDRVANSLEARQERGYDVVAIMVPLARASNRDRRTREERDAIVARLLTLPPAKKR